MSHARVPLHRSALAALAAALGLGSIATAADDQCRVRLQIGLEASVENPRDPAFLSALAASPMYALRWVEGSDETAVYELTGPASDFQCEEAVGRLSRNAAVTDVQVIPAAPAQPAPPAQPPAPTQPGPVQPVAPAPAPG